MPQLERGVELSRLTRALALGCMAASIGSCGIGGKEEVSGTGKLQKLCFAYQDMETQFWVAAHNQVVQKLKREGVTVIERNANEDGNKQLQQVKDCITQQVDAILVIPQDGASAVPIVRAANRAGIPIALFNRDVRPGAEVERISVVADNEQIAEKTVDFLAKKAEAKGGKIKPLILVGDLGDVNAVARRNGFNKAIARYPGLFTPPVEVATKWDAPTALANLKSALRAHPDVGLIFTSSDFMLPQIQASLMAEGKWHKAGSPQHVILGGFDGDANACKLIGEGYADATGVQDVGFEVDAALAALRQAVAEGKPTVNKQLSDPGFVAHSGNLDSSRDRIWGCATKG